MTEWCLEPGERFYCGYHEWLVHPFEARVILDRGYVIFNGLELDAQQVGMVGVYPQIRVPGLGEFGMASDPQLPAADAVTRWVEDESRVAA